MKPASIMRWLRIGVLVAPLACNGSDESEIVEPDGGTTILCGSGEAPRPGGGCDPTGVPADACSAGFVSDDAGGCIAVLPKDACGSGTLAIPGETSCHELAPCGAEPWGDIPVDSGTVYVDAAYLQGDADGSAQKPYPELQQAIDVAPWGALVAVAAGTYDPAFIGKPLRLWGRCPEMVSCSEAAARASGASAPK